MLNPLLEGQKRFFKEFFPENSAFMYGYFSREIEIKSGVWWHTYSILNTKLVPDEIVVAVDDKANW